MKSKFIKIVLFLILFIGIISCDNVQAVDIPELKIVDYSDEYKEYMALSDEEKSERIEPSKYNVITPKTNSEYLNNLNNIFKSATLVRSALDSEYDLRDIILQNLVVKNQMSTNSCWAFATIGALESNIALLDYKAGRTGNVYDFSERHMDYSVRSNAFNNSANNEYGYNIGFDRGGTFLMGQSYLSNGMGAIDEAEMPFENNEDNIDISEIQNKNTTTTLYDTILFEDVEDIGKAELMSKMKQVISNYGGIYAIFHGAQLLSDSYNNETGAMYCPEESTTSEYPSNHAGVIVGWDDNYSKENFAQENQPENDGAWIVKNSWGSSQTFNLTEIKEELYTNYTEECNQAGYNSAEEIENDFIIQIVENTFGTGTASIDGENVVVTIGDNGFMYISYEDKNIYSELYAIEKATSTKDYDNIYQNNLLHPGLAIQMESSDDLYIANKFTRDSGNNNEVLTMVSIFTMQEVTCKVFVNPESDDLTNIQEVALEAGNTITLEPGYHTIMLAEPVKLTGSSFAVAMSLQSGTGTQTFMVESKSVDENSIINSNESFFTSSSAIDAGVWEDLATYEDGNVHGNVSIKAFTEEETQITPAELTGIEITNPPSSTTYTEGDNFNTSGMIVTATYSDLTTKQVTDYDVLNGENLYYGQETVTISYTENGITMQVEQAITVNQLEPEPDREIVSIEIETLPTKTIYTQNEELDLTGGIVKVTYSDGTTIEMNLNSKSFTLTGYNNQTLGTQTITVEYEGYTTTFEVEVVETTTEPVLSDFSNAKVNITDAKVYLFKEIIEDDYIDMNIQISNITGRDENTDYTYYYYLSDSKSEDNTSGWVEIQNVSVTENQDGTYTMTVSINTKDIINFDDLNDADNIYLYVREVAIASGESVEQIYTSSPIEINGENVTYYLDNEYQGNVDDIIDNNNPIITPDDNNNSEDPTISPDPIPNAGVIYIGIVAIVLIAIIGIYFFIKNKNIDK